MQQRTYHRCTLASSLPFCCQHHSSDIHSCWTFNQSFLCYSTGGTFDWMANTQHNVGHSFSTSTVESNSANSSYTASDNVSQDCVTQTLELCYRHTLFCFNSFKTSECLDYNFEYSCNADIYIYIIVRSRIKIIYAVKEL